jgi:hypothetical protein
VPSAEEDSEIRSAMGGVPRQRRLIFVLSLIALQPILCRKRLSSKKPITVLESKRGGSIIISVTDC